MSLRGNIGREHVTENEKDCWCLPRKYTLCPGCGDREDEDEKGCWQCEGQDWLGMVPWNGLDDATLIVVHNEVRYLKDGEPHPNRPKDDTDG